MLRLDHAIGSAPVPVDALAIVNARVWTGDPRRPWADAILVRGERIDVVGSSAEVKKLAGASVKTVDAHGMMVTPGFVDAHVHFLDGGFGRDAAEEPTGVLEDSAMDLMSGAIPEMSMEMSLRTLDAAMTYVAERGVTSVHHMGSWADLDVFEHAQELGLLRTRISANVPLSTWTRLRDTIAARGRGDSWLRIGGLKGFVDASLGSHTAAMLEPFTDVPTDPGLFVNTEQDLYAWTASADEAGLQVIMHAIGDRAISTQLDIFERVAREHGARDRRFRIEHAQHIAPADFARFGSLGVIASMQPYHAIDDGRWADKVIGPERAKGTYAFKSLLDHGARLAFGSDWNVAPLVGIYAAVTRRTLDDARPNVWVPEQKITVEQALRAYTAGSAYAGYQETEVGMLKPGMLADLVVIDKDLTRIEPEAIRDARVMLTLVGGRIMFDRDGVTH